MRSFLEIFHEKFSDMGRLSPEQLQKGQRLSQDDQDNFHEVSGRVFHKVLMNIMHNNDLRKDQNKNLRENLTLYEVKDYLLMRCFIGRNNSSGFAIKDGDELVSVFSSQQSSGNALVHEAIKQGARRLDCFAKQDQNGNIVKEGLFKLYSRHGFVVDKDMNSGNVGEPYSTQNGVSYFVDDNGNVDPNDPQVVIYMKRK
jgi:hypothetical protein